MRVGSSKVLVRLMDLFSFLSLSFLLTCRSTPNISELSIARAVRRDTYVYVSTLTFSISCERARARLILYFFSYDRTRL